MRIHDTPSRCTWINEWRWALKTGTPLAGKTFVQKQAVATVFYFAYGKPLRFT